MWWHKLYGVFYNHSGWPLKSWAAGCAVLWFVFIRRGKENDQGLLAHEMDHVKQFWSNPVFHGPQYLWSWRYRLRCELEAYQTQIRVTLQHHPGKSREVLAALFAGFIATRYKIRIIPSRAQELLGCKNPWTIDL